MNKITNFLAHVIDTKQRSMIFSVVSLDPSDIKGKFLNLDLDLCCAISISDKERYGYELVARQFSMINYTCLCCSGLIMIGEISELPSIPDFPMIFPSRPVHPLPHEIYISSLPWVLL